MTTDWMVNAKCAGTADASFAKSDPFYPDAPKGKPGRPKNGNDTGRDYTQAKSICQTCPVTSQCYAFGAKDPDGVWGGTTPEQRKSAERLARYHRSNPQAGHRQKVPA